eukprot:5939700-Alexandrium_andersonii.AAC.1
MARGSVRVSVRASGKVSGRAAFEFCDPRDGSVSPAGAEIMLPGIVKGTSWRWVSISRDREDANGNTMGTRC